MPNERIQFKGDFSQLAEFIGSAEGWSDSIKTPYFIGEMLKAAHSGAKKMFDKETAALAATGVLNISHMYEWGTAGINEGKGTPKLSPNSRLAKLWQHKLSGRGASRKIDFIMLPSKQPVPLPNTSGMTFAGKGKPPSRRYTFAARPWVTEYGIPTVIRPTAASALFIPANSDMKPTGVGRYSNQRALARGYFMYPHPVVIRERKGTGQFTTHWHAWWNSEGKAIISEGMDKIVDGTARRNIYTGLQRYSGIKKGSLKAFNLEVANAKARANARMRVREAGILREFQKDTFEGNLAALEG